MFPYSDWRVCVKGYFYFCYVSNAAKHKNECAMQKKNTTNYLDSKLGMQLLCIECY